MEEQLRQEFPLLRGGGGSKTYLDHAGAALYAKSQVERILDAARVCKTFRLLSLQIEAVTKELLSGVHLSPHTSVHALEEVRAARKEVLGFFGADAGEYAAVFTSGATAAIRIVGEGFFSQQGENPLLAYARECHTSVVGLRELCHFVGGHVKVLSRKELEKEEDDEDEATAAVNKKLLVFPAMSNFCGSKFPIREIVRRYQRKGYLVLLDAAAFASTNPLKLSILGGPDFVSVSFYKLFGYPTGLGALLARRDSLQTLAEGKRYFGGGTVEMHLVDRRWHRPRAAHLEEYFEDGTLPFLQIGSLKHGFHALSSLGGGMELISRRTFELAASLFRRMEALKHPNGQKLVQVYADTDFKDRNRQGAIVTFNLLKPDGSHFGFNSFRRVAEQEGVSIRTGCFCNVGACQKHLKFDDCDTLRNFESGHVCGDDVDVLRGRPVGAIRVSFGYYNAAEDVEKVVAILEKHFVATEHVPERPTNPGNIRARVHRVCLYPVKSCAPMTVPSSWPTWETGLAFDRRWAVMDQKTGRCLNQKKLRALCLVRPKVDADKGTLKLHHPKMAPLTIAIEPEVKDSSSSPVGAPCVSGRVCNEQMEAVDCGEEAARWLQEATGEDGIRLVRQSDQDDRLSSSKLSLVNTSPYLVLNRASVAEVARKMREEFANQEPEETFDVEKLLGQFRGNIVLDCEEPFAEDFWRTITFPSSPPVVLRRHLGCMRCGMISIDQDTGEEVRGLSRTLAYMTDRGFKFGTLFGADPGGSGASGAASATVGAAGSIRVGDSAVIELSETPLS